MTHRAFAVCVCRAQEELYLMRAFKAHEERRFEDRDEILNRAREQAREAKMIEERPE